MYCTLRRLMVLIACALTFLGCKTLVFQKSLDIDWDGEMTEGTITVSKPKMYQRASLINERKARESWLGKLIVDSETVTFTPEIAREIEQITTFAAALGLRFDSASAIQNKHAAESGDIQQQIDVLKLQLQLDQLKQDAALLRAGLAQQTAPVNENLGKLSAATDGASTSLAAAPSAALLKTAIDSISANLAEQLNVERKLPLSVPVTNVNPADLFRDRTAYRDLLEAARNGISLDDLHDMNGHGLTRLSFQAMVLPDRRDSKVPAVIQMRIRPPQFTARQLEAIYKGWLEHINRKLNRKLSNEKKWEPDYELLNSAISDHFDLVEYRFDPSRAALPDCVGLSPKTAQNSACATLTFAVPKFAGSSAQEGAYANLQAYKFWFFLNKTETEDIDRDTRERALIATTAKTIIRDCGRLIETDGEEATILFQAVRRAQILAAAGDVFTNVNRLAYQILGSAGVALPATNEENQKIFDRAARARKLLATFANEAYRGCPAQKIREFYADSPMNYVSNIFENAFSGDQSVWVYEIGPREQVQQVSSIVRVADNLSLAAALVASAPGKGLDASANATYSRQAIGKTATIERLPAVLGYAAQDDTFGWVIGPRAVLDLRGSVQLEQTPRTFDLSVDLSLPGWWPYFTIDIVSVWSPKRMDIVGGKVAVPERQPKSVRVDMRPNYADFEALTARLKLNGGTQDRQVYFDANIFDRQIVNACRPTTLYLSGGNIWRTTSAMIGGRLLKEEAMSVAPDMSGILLTIPELGNAVAEQGEMPGSFLSLSVFTRYGPATGMVPFVPKPAGGCVAADKQAPPDKADTPKGPAITLIEPARIRPGADVTVTIHGSNLGPINRVTINGQPGTVIVEKDGKSLKAKFLAAQTASLPRSRRIMVAFYKDDTYVAEKSVEVTSTKGVM